MNDSIIRVKNVSMGFRMDLNRVASLKEWAITFLSGRKKVEQYWALRNISFDVMRGEVVGLIGRNGSGKSTTLKIISGIFRPTEGSVELDGRVVPMLELGSGFDYELTGRENIFLNGAILGYPRDFLHARCQAIIDFSELNDFIDMPLKTYSSGMVMRLAFSIATVVDPQILIVDEILAVGDEAFQRKSFARMQELMNGGATVLFVSHNLDQIRLMCHRVVWLENSAIRMIGPTAEVCDAYAAANRS